MEETGILQATLTCSMGVKQPSINKIISGGMLHLRNNLEIENILDVDVQ